MTDIARIFAADPLGHSKKDLNALIKELRSYRHQFELGNIKAGSTKPRSDTQLAAAELKDKVTLDIKDLL